MDRLGFWGADVRPSWRVQWQFQYPLMDRLGFWGKKDEVIYGDLDEFQYPLMDRLGFWGAHGLAHHLPRRDFSIR